MNKPISAALISVAGTMLSDGERRLIEQYRPLGVSLFARNIESRSQLAELTRQIREAAEDENIIIAVDQEGGRVRRLAEPEFRPYASQYVLGKIGETYGQEEAEAGRNAATREATTAGAVALDDEQQVEPDQRQQQPAHAKQREAEAGHRQAP